MSIRSFSVHCGKISRTLRENHRCYSFSKISLGFNHEDLVSSLRSCEEVNQIAQIHGLMLKIGLDRISFPVSKLLAHICKQGLMDYASSVFRLIENPNLFMFNSMLRGFSVSRDPVKCLLFFNCMRCGNHIEELLLDQFTFVSVLKSCSSLRVASAGLGIHALGLKSGCDLFLNVGNALVHFYCVCGRIQDAHQVFDELCERKDVVSWSSLMWGYLSMAEYNLVIELFKKLCSESCGVSITTILGVLQASGEIRNPSVGELIHALCIKIGLLSNLSVVTALISTYGKQGHIRSARSIFDEIDAEKDVILWNCLIDAYGKTGFVQEASGLLKLMKHSGIKPSSSTLASFLSSCSASGALDVGQSVVHDFFEENPFVLDAVLGTTMVDMYAKSGLLEKSIAIFNRIEDKDVKSWTAMISGYGLNGKPDSAISLFVQMEEEGYTPNEVTFLALLNSCSHGGMVSEGTRLLKRMVDDYKLTPKIEHYGCVIDLLGRAGMLEEAYELLKGLRVSDTDGTGWRALLGACRVYGNIGLAERVKDEVEKIDGGHPADELALGSIYAAVGVEERDKGDELRSHRYLVKKEAGCSRIDTSCHF